MKIINGEPHASTFLYIRTNRVWQPEDALNYFGISKYKRDQSFDSLFNRLWFYDDGEWLHMLDGWDYTLYSQINIESKLIELSNLFEVVWICVGECDLSFDYAIYKHGKCIRKLLVDSPLYTDQVVKVSIGTIQDFEQDIVNGSGEIMIKDPNKYISALLTMITKLGIKPNYNEESLLVYRHEKPWWKFW